MGPSALRVALLEVALEQLGHEVMDLGNVEVPVAEATDQRGDPPAADAEERLHYPDAIAATCATTLELLRPLPADDFVITLGGDHSIGMGTVPGLARGERTGVIWVDAHADINTPESSPSGNIHGMPIAHLLGLGDARFTGLWGAAALRPEDLVYIGLRSVDPPERELIHDLGILSFSMKEIDQRGIARVAAEAIERLSGRSRVHVSFDADALDPSLAPGVGTPVPGGLTYREAHLLMELLADSRLVTSLDLVEVNPTLDRGNQTAEVLVEMAASLLGKRIL